MSPSTKNKSFFTFVVICSNIPTYKSHRYEVWFMGCTIVTSREFNQDVSKAKRDALKGPVFITDRGRTAHVLLSVKDYQKITDRNKSIAELLAMPGVSDIDFEVPRSDSELYNPAGL